MSGPERRNSGPRPAAPRKGPAKGGKGPGGRGASPPAEAGERPGTWRLFYALRVPGEVSPALAQAQAKLRGNWRTVRPDQLHITLSYLPAVPPGRVGDLTRLGAQVARETPPLHVRLRGTGYFPNEGSPRVWFVKAEAEGLSDLAERLRAGVQELGLSTDDLAFKAHVTLARKKGPAPRLPPLLFEQDWAAPSLTLYRSVLRKTGPIYEVQSSFRFQGQALQAAEIQASELQTSKPDTPDPSDPPGFSSESASSPSPAPSAPQEHP